MNKPIYRVVDGKGRILIPRQMRERAEIHYGDIVRLGVQSNGSVCVRKVDIVEAGDQSPEALRAYVFSAIKELDTESRLSLATKLLELVEREQELGVN